MPKPPPSTDSVCPPHETVRETAHEAVYRAWDDAGEPGSLAGLRLSGALFLQSHRPLQFVLGQAAHALAPFVALLGLDEWVRGRSPPG